MRTTGRQTQPLIPFSNRLQRVSSVEFSVDGGVRDKLTERRHQRVGVRLKRLDDSLLKLLLVHNAILSA